jgi:protein-tyrosine-phosphatase
MTGTRRPSILFVCTANQCRSPLAEAIAHQLLPEFDTASAGTAAVDGIPATPEITRAAAKAGYDLSAHRSRRITRGILDGADLILTMEQAHLAPIAEVDAAAAARTVPLLKLARTVDLAGPPSNEPAALRTWIREFCGDDVARVFDTTTSFDVADPTSHGARRHRRSATELIDAIRELGQHLP